MQLFDCKYTRSHLTAQLFYEYFYRTSSHHKAAWQKRLECLESRLQAARREGLGGVIPQRLKSTATLFRNLCKSLFLVAASRQSAANHPKIKQFCSR
jgi:hypothetical protein